MFKKNKNENESNEIYAALQGAGRIAVLLTQGVPPKVGQVPLGWNRLGFQPEK